MKSYQVDVLYFGDANKNDTILAFKKTLFPNYTLLLAPAVPFKQYKLIHTKKGYFHIFLYFLKSIMQNCNIHINRFIGCEKLNKAPKIYLFRLLVTIIMILYILQQLSTLITLSLLK